MFCDADQPLGFQPHQNLHFWIRPWLSWVTMFFASHVLRLKAGHCNHFDSFPVDEYRLHFPACFRGPLTYFQVHMAFSFCWLSPGPQAKQCSILTTRSNNMTCWKKNRAAWHEVEKVQQHEKKQERSSNLAPRKSNQIAKIDIKDIKQCDVRLRRCGGQVEHEVDKIKQPSTIKTKSTSLTWYQENQTAKHEVVKGKRRSMKSWI